MNKVYLLLGSNIGDSKIKLQEATKFIEEKIGGVQKASSFYTTAAWGDISQNEFVNQVLLIHSKYNAQEILFSIFEIEAVMGRVRTTKNAAREIDIDILFFNNEIINTKHLTIPHMEIQNRKFVLTPLKEIAPSFIHPLLKKDVSTLLLNCKDVLNVQKI